jgi:surface protein
MIGMFSHAESFNQPLEKWDVSEITQMSRMFEETKAMKKLPSWDEEIEDLLVNAGAVRHKDDEDDIDDERLRDSVVEILTNVYPSFMKLSEIYNELVKDGFPGTVSFRRHLCGKALEWYKEGVLKRLERGVYMIVTK